MNWVANKFAAGWRKLSYQITYLKNIYVGMAKLVIYPLQAPS